MQFEDESIYPINRKSLSVAPPDKPRTGSKRKAADEATAESEGCRHEKKRVRALKGKDVIASTEPVKRSKQDEPAEAGSSGRQNAAAAAAQASAATDMTPLQPPGGQGAGVLEAEQPVRGAAKTSSFDLEVASRGRARRRVACSRGAARM